MKLRPIAFEITQLGGFERNDKKNDLDVGTCVHCLFDDRPYLRDLYLI